MFVSGLSLVVSAGAQTVFTKPAGYVKLGNTTVGEDAVPANTDMRIAVPLETKTDFVGTVTSTTATEIVVAGTPGFTVDQWGPGSGFPYQAKISDGSEEGLWAPIVSNTADTLTVTVSVGDLTNVTAGDGVQILKCWTAASVFEGQTIPPGTQLLLFSGTQAGQNVSSDTILVWSGANWFYLFGGSGNADDLILHPGESFIIRTGGTPIAKLTTFGEVPMTKHRSVISKIDPSMAQDSVISYFGPVPEIIGDSGLGITPGDQLLIFDNASAGLNKSASQILVYSGSAWFGLFGVSGDVTNTFTLKPGVGYIYRQAASGPAGDTEWSDTQTYNE